MRSKPPPAKILGRVKSKSLLLTTKAEEKSGQTRECHIY